MKRDKDVTAEEMKLAFPEIVFEIQQSAFNAGSERGFLDAAAQIKRGGTVPAMSIPEDIVLGVVSAVGPGALPPSVPYEKSRLTASDFQRAYPQVFAKLERQYFIVGYQRGLLNAQLQVKSESARDKRNLISAMESPIIPAAASPAVPVLPAMTFEEKIKQAWDTNPAMRGEFANDFTIYKAFQEAAAAGLVKLYGNG